MAMPENELHPAEENPNPMPNMVFNDIRVDARLSQIELAHWLGINPQQVSRYERGVAVIPRTVAIDMAYLRLFGPIEPFGDDWKPAVQATSAVRLFTIETGA